MAEEPSCSSSQSSEKTVAPTVTKITDLDEDSLAHCASYLTFRDLSNLAMTSKPLRAVVYSDAIWLDRFRALWPLRLLSSTSGVRPAYLDRRKALHQFRFFDPVGATLFAQGFSSVQNMLLDKNDIIFSQGPMIKMINVDSILSGGSSFHTMIGHTSRVTCLRLFPVNETSLAQSGTTQTEENVLVTSNCDGSIRLWWKGGCRRIFGGPHGAVLTLSDKLLGNGSVKVLASGEHGGAICLWSLSSGGVNSRKALKARFYGDRNPVRMMSVAGYRPSHLVTMSNDSVVRLWDTTRSSSVSYSKPLEKATVCGPPVDMKCHEDLLYIASGSSVVVLDLRTMKIVSTIAICIPEIFSLTMIPSKSLVCTGGYTKAMLWDVRKCQGGSWTPTPVTELYHWSPVTHLHMDPYRIVTGGRWSNIVNTWDTDTGKRTMTLACNHPGSIAACSSMAINACRIVTACHLGAWGLVHYFDFSNATCPFFPI